MTAPIEGRVFLHSVHASLEWDYGQILQALGLTLVNGNLNRSHEERPLIPGYGDIDYGDEMRERVNTMTCGPEDFAGCDMILMMNPADFHQRAAYFATFKPTCVYVNGQWIDLQMDELAGKMNGQHDRGEQPNIWVVVYTKREENYLRARVHTQLQDRIHHIRFAKKFEDYAPWVLTGEKPPQRQPYIYTTCHDIHRRALSCNWSEYQGVTTGLPRKLSGRNTNEVGGQGLITFELMKKQMAECAGYMGVPCHPAPLVLNMIEAMCSGAPVAYFDNERGIAEEGIFEDGVGKCSKHISELRTFLEKCLNDAGFRKAQSEASIMRAKQFFQFDKQVEKWRQVFESMSSLWK